MIRLSALSVATGDGDLFADFGAGPLEGWASAGLSMGVRAMRGFRRRGGLTVGARF